MRLRNVKGATELLNNHPLVVNKPELHKGQWKIIFGNDHPICIEIGMGKGDFIKQMALLNPQVNYIGIEKFDSVLVRACQKMPEDIPNLRLIRYDATYIDDLFDLEIDLIYLNHSDPWPKARHAKRRLTSPYFASLYKKISINDVNIVMKTDNCDLFDYSVESLAQSKYELTTVDYDYNSQTNVLTEYERRFRGRNQPIFYLEAVYRQHR